MDSLNLTALLEVTTWGRPHQHHLKPETSCQLNTLNRRESCVFPCSAISPSA